MQVVKRNGKHEDVSFDKVLNRIQLAAQGLEVNPTLIAQRTLLRIYDGVKTSELDELAAQLLAGTPAFAHAAPAAGLCLVRVIY
jgi:transcriptional regulator NrdR family protein